MYKLLLCFGISVLSLSIQARTICENSKIKNVYIEAERPSDPQYSNKLLLNFDTPCAGKPYAYIENDAKSYDGILSAIMMSHASGKKITIVVDEGTTVGIAARIEYVYF